MKLVLIRHGQSEWNEENRFTGWTDIDLSEAGLLEAKSAGRVLKENGFDFDICYTSFLKRAIHTLNAVLFELDREWLPVIKTWELNERHYGSLQGLNKAETAAKYGEEQVKVWRRSFDVRPPALEPGDERNPSKSEQYRAQKDTALPLTESLKDTFGRTIPFFDRMVKADIQNGRRVLVVAHGNSLRAIAKYIENLSDGEITGVEIPTGMPLVYEFDGSLNFTHKYFLENK